jgi:hypothetical protein
VCEAHADGAGESGEGVGEPSLSSTARRNLCRRRGPGARVLIFLNGFLDLRVVVVGNFSQLWSNECVFLVD